MYGKQVGNTKPDRFTSKNRKHRKIRAAMAKASKRAHR
jgi:hypothetical protein